MFVCKQKKTQRKIVYQCISNHSFIKNDLSSITWPKRRAKNDPLGLNRLIHTTLVATRNTAHISNQFWKR